MQNTADIMNIRDYTLTEFHQSRGDGDGGRLFLATDKTDKAERWVIKTGGYETGCNEYMYFKVAKAVGLYTPEIRLITDNGYGQAAAVRFIPNIKPFVEKEADENGIAEMCRFYALYCILDEEDSFELFCDVDGRVLKLDNSASFRLNYLSAGLLKQMGFKNEITQNTLNTSVASSLKSYVKSLINKFGATTEKAFVDTVSKFAEIGGDAFESACETLCANYPFAFVDYFKAFIEKRKEDCLKFLNDKGERS
jgi:hypothetical protein